MMKIYDKKLAYPYFVWMTLFTVVPLIIVVYYAFTDANGAFTLDNLTSISGYGSCCWHSLPRSFVWSLRSRWAIFFPDCG
jgi:spermidine/putrescine transport system permease protein